MAERACEHDTMTVSWHRYFDVPLPVEHCRCIFRCCMSHMNVVPLLTDFYEILSAQRHRHTVNKTKAGLNYHAHVSSLFNVNA